MTPFHPDLIAAVHEERTARLRGQRAGSPRRGDPVRWVRGQRHSGRGEREA